MVGKNVDRGRSIHGHDLAVEDSDGVARDRLHAIAIQSHVIGEVDRAVTAAGVKPDDGIGGNGATTYVESAARSEHADLDYVAGERGICHIDYPGRAVVPHLYRPAIRLDRSSHINVAAGGFESDIATVVRPG